MDRNKKVEELLRKIMDEYDRADAKRGQKSWKSVSLRQQQLAKLALLLLRGEDPA